MTGIGDRIKDCRQWRYWTAASLADRSRISRSLLSGFESGVKTPSIASLIKIASILEVFPGWLIDGRGRRWSAPVLLGDEYPPELLDYASKRFVAPKEIEFMANAKALVDEVAGRVIEVDWIRFANGLMEIRRAENAL